MLTIRNFEFSSLVKLWCACLRWPKKPKLWLVLIFNGYWLSCPSKKHGALRGKQKTLQNRCLPASQPTHIHKVPLFLPSFISPNTIYPTTRRKHFTFQEEIALAFVFTELANWRETFGRARFQQSIQQSFWKHFLTLFWLEEWRSGEQKLVDYYSSFPPSVHHLRTSSLLRPTSSIWDPSPTDFLLHITTTTTTKTATPSLSKRVLLLLLLLLTGLLSTLQPWTNYSISLFALSFHLAHPDTQPSFLSFTAVPFFPTPSLLSIENSSLGFSPPPLLWVRKLTTSSLSI